MPRRHFVRMRAFERWIEAAFVPPRLRGDPAASRTAMLVAEFSLVPLGFVPILAVLEWISFPRDVAARLALLVLASLPSCVAVPVVLRYTGSTRLAGNWMLAHGFAVMSIVTYYSGGPISPPSFWNVLLPMAAVPVVGRRWAIFWAGLVVSEAFALAWLERHGLALQNQILPERRGLYWLVSIGFLASLVTLAGLVFERTKDLALHHVEAANAAHARAPRRATSSRRSPTRCARR